jgi:hypothetical protein
MKTEKSSTKSNRNAGLEALQFIADGSADEIISADYADYRRFEKLILKEMYRIKYLCNSAKAADKNLT